MINQILLFGPCVEKGGYVSLLYPIQSRIGMGRVAGLLFDQDQ